MTSENLNYILDWIDQNIYLTEVQLTKVCYVPIEDNGLPKHNVYCQAFRYVLCFLHQINNLLSTFIWALLLFFDLLEAQSEGFSFSACFVILATGRCVLLALQSTIYEVFFFCCLSCIWGLKSLLGTPYSDFLDFICVSNKYGRFPENLVSWCGSVFIQI